MPVVRGEWSKDFPKIRRDKCDPIRHLLAILGLCSHKVEEISLRQLFRETYEELKEEK